MILIIDCYASSDQLTPLIIWKYVTNTSDKGGKTCVD